MKLELQLIQPKKTVMHTAIAYDRDDNSTGRKYYAYDVVTVDPKKK